jgi:hypothetical protein
MKWRYWTPRWMRAKEERRTAAIMRSIPSVNK